MNPQTILTIGDLAVKAAQLYTTLRANHSDLPTFEELLAKADANFDAVEDAAKKELGG